ncbi:hypothetical protein [Hydrogenophaga sp. MI9]|uniref:hypothetical protein n=1 Tax=Hydrogenophaga sp. MI9 TaxID=3453719 RepID=UPI003EEDD8C2
MIHRLNLAELQRIKQWHVDHREDHPLEYHLWDAMLTVWVMGWMGWLPAMAMHALWALPLCVAGIVLPRLYVEWRERAHAAHRLRCDWLVPQA